MPTVDWGMTPIKMWGQQLQSWPRGPGGGWSVDLHDFGRIILGKLSWPYVLTEPWNDGNWIRWWHIVIYPDCWMGLEGWMDGLWEGHGTLWIYAALSLSTGPSFKFTRLNALYKCEQIHHGDTKENMIFMTFPDGLMSFTVILIPKIREPWRDDLRSALATP